jgi:hypothetical protein
VNDNTDCESLTRKSVTLTIGAAPAAPTANDQTECEENPIQTLTATATPASGSSVTWYDAPTGGNIVLNPVLSFPGSVTYYAGSKNNQTDCYSLTRTAVTLTINPAPPAPTGSNYSLCVSDINNIPTIVATASLPAGYELTWFDAPTGGNLVTNLSWNQLGSITFYAESKNSVTGCISIDRTPVTLTLQVPPEVIVGDDISICETEQFIQVSGSASNVSQVLWTTNGSGFFDDPNAESTMYFFSGQDQGTIEMCLTAFAISPCTGAPDDCFSITINPNPEAFAGDNVSICEVDSYYIADASASDYSSLEWTTLGDGSFDDVNAENPEYTPGTNDISNGSVVLCISAAPKVGCTISADDCMTLTIATDPTVEFIDGEVSLACDDYNYAEGKWKPVVMNAATTGDVGSVQWTSDGDGYFDDPTALNTVYNLGLGDIWKGDIELCVEVLGIPQCPSSSSDCMMVYVPQQLIYYDKNTWWGLSSYLDTDQQTVPEVMDPLVLIPGSQHLVTMIDKQGKYFWPEPLNPSNIIGDWSAVGYKIKIKNADACLPIYGDSLTDQTFEVSGAYTFLPVLTNVPVKIEDLFGSHVSDVLLIYDWPVGKLWTEVASDFDELQPGRAYLMVNRNVSNSYTIEFPDFDPEAPHVFPNTKDLTVYNSPWNSITNTAQPHILMFADEALMNLEQGDVIGVFNKEDVCYGSAEYLGKDSFMKLVAMGTSSISKQINGFEAGEVMNFKIYRQSTGETIEVQFIFDENFPSHDGLFTVNGASRVIGITIGPTGVGEISGGYNVNVYPNPARNMVNISSDKLMKGVTLLNQLGQVILSQEFSDKMHQIDISSQPTGIYILRVKLVDGNVTTKRVTIK